MKVTKEIEKRFWSKVKKTSKCWEWTGAKTLKGYGRVRINTIYYLTHRVSYCIYHQKEIPKGMNICHKCDNPKCVNPYHLFMGSQSENLKDAFKKGRVIPPSKVSRLRGEEVPTHKLKFEQVKRIRMQNESVKKLAQEFKVSKSIIYKIRQRIRWKDF